MSNQPNRPATPNVKPDGAPVVAARRRSSAAVKTPSRPLPGWIDWLVLVVAVGISIVVVFFTAQSQAFSVPITQDALWSWHLIRSCGLVAYSMLAASTLWGVFLSSRVIKEWASGPLSLLLHAATSWLAIIFSIAHVLLLLVDTYLKFLPLNLVVPFTGPYRPLPTGLGTIGFWLMLVISISFWLRKLIGQKGWYWLHLTSYLVFGLITAHALFAGTDGAQPGFQIVLVAFFVLVTGLIVFRIGQSIRRNRASTPPVSRAPRTTA